MEKWKPKHLKTWRTAHKNTSMSTKETSIMACTPTTCHMRRRKVQMKKQRKHNAKSIWFFCLFRTFKRSHGEQQYCTTPKATTALYTYVAEKWPWFQQANTSYVATFKCQLWSKATSGRWQCLFFFLLSLQKLFFFTRGILQPCIKQW